ncbi:MAG: hypothetical protein AAF743_17235 [Planctomycetota bacterium]
MDATADRTGGGAVALVAIVGWSLVRLGVMAGLGLGWLVAVDMLLGAVALGWVFRRLEAGLALTATMPAWVVLATVAEGGTVGDAAWPAVLATVWCGGLAAWGCTVDSDTGRQRAATTCTAWLLASMVAAYVAATITPTIPHSAVSPMLAGTADAEDWAIFPWFSALFAVLPSAAWLAVGFARRFSTRKS